MTQQNLISSQELVLQTITQADIVSSSFSLQDEAIASQKLQDASCQTETAVRQDSRTVIAKSLEALIVAGKKNGYQRPPMFSFLTAFDW